MTLGQLAEAIGGVLEGEADPARVVRGAAPLDQAGPEEISFLANPRYERHLAATKAAAVIVAKAFKGAGAVPLIRCDDAYLAFRQAMVALHGFRKAPFIGLHRNAHIDQRATMGRDVVAGPYATVCEGASVGDRSVLYPGVFVGPHARIGSDCVLYPNVTIYDGCILGNRVTVHANSVIGEDGFGYATHRGAHHKIPQAGHVEIGDDVEVGAGCTIDRATIGATRIGAGTKFSNLVAIGHGTQIGRHNLLVAQAGVAGSVTVGDYCAFAGQAGVVGHITIGDRVRVGAQAGVTNDIPSDTEVVGSPAAPLAQGRKSLILITQLPEMRNQIRALGRDLKSLERRLAELPGAETPTDEPERDTDTD